MPTITNKNTGASWKYSGPFNGKNNLEMYVLDYSGKIVLINNAYSDGRLTAIFNTVYEVTFDNPSVWTAYKDIEHLFNQSCSDLHKIQNRNIEFSDKRAQFAIKLLRKEIDRVREKTKMKKQLTQLQQKVYDFVLSHYNYRTSSNLVTKKSLPHHAIEIMYNVTIHHNI